MEKEQACIKTVITVINCCDLSRLGDDGCCAKCNVGAGCTLVAMYKVMTKFANDTEATVSNVSMAGTTSGLKISLLPNYPN